MVDTIITPTRAVAEGVDLSFDDLRKETSTYQNTLDPENIITYEEIYYYETPHVTDYSTNNTIPWRADTTGDLAWSELVYGNTGTTTWRNGIEKCTRALTYKTESKEGIRKLVYHYVAETATCNCAELIATCNVSANAWPSEGGDASCSPSSVTVRPGEKATVNFTATPKSGYEFYLWGYRGVSSYQQHFFAYIDYEFAVSASAVTATAYFNRIKYTITASASVSPAEAAAAGCSASVSPSSQTGYYGESATFSFSASAVAGWKFVSWSDGGAQTHGVTVAFGAVTSVARTATFEELYVDKYRIDASTSINPAVAGTAGCTATVDPPYAIGELGESASFSFSATSCPGWKFVSWSDGGAKTHGVTETFGPDAVKSLTRTANFDGSEGIMFTVTTKVSPENAGSSSGGGSYTNGQSCTVKTKGKCSPWVFKEWQCSNGKISSDLDFTFTVSEDVTCTAVYDHTDSKKLFVSGGCLLATSDGSKLLYDGDAVER